MHRRATNSVRAARVALHAALVAASVIALTVVAAACGSSGRHDTTAQARALLRDTFVASHPASSGRVQIVARVMPASGGEGARGTAHPPLVVTVDGPFQRGAGGGPPASDLTVSVTGDAVRGGFTARIVSTGSRGYVIVSGATYALSRAELAQFASGFDSLAAPRQHAHARTAATAAIDPMLWLADPEITGVATVDGEQTTEIHAHVDTAALLRDVSTLLARERARTLDPADQARIAARIANPTVRVWTGAHDHIARRIQLTFGRVRDSGEPLAVDVTIDYTQLDRPQTIIAPRDHTEPLTDLIARIRAMAGAG